MKNRGRLRPLGKGDFHARSAARTFAISACSRATTASARRAQGPRLSAVGSFVRHFTRYSALRREHHGSQLLDRTRGLELQVAKLEAAVRALELTLPTERGKMLDLPNPLKRVN